MTHTHYWYMLQDPRLQETIILGDEFSLITLIDYQIELWRKGGITLHKKEPEIQIGSFA
jgi:hypothetical protein